LEGSFASSSKVRKPNIWIIALLGGTITVVVVIAILCSVNTPIYYDPPTPAGAMSPGSNSSGNWVFTVVAISQTNVRITDCTVFLTIDDLRSDAYAFSASSRLNMHIGSVTSYDLKVKDVGELGYLSAGDEFVIGPVGNSTGNNAFQPLGTQVIIHILYAPSGGQIVEGRLTVH
jgi:hypothetical protein